ncbi:glutamine-hydrolyzing GMP synthase [Candidatus Curtissbacteria bacterium RIFCSPLOWO2_02_FULL_40_13b]|uniref:GMP synthase [glutamine-hydrolyzing] n=2 Tax=Candidatus Curtissiibacteriota TaxID=1752717 RepID=A0A1F5HTQ3_9BACT|nr:MAG: glutamine-hydrolyzing GMP synthase [Candidatus Curtissbacteria bacterium RIFCSPHIGHO2_12_FULL_41_17]OGE07541.1 MAG: glutamine-hydrolyzing GMP synthase [Candidatus Curtissbacteria bacterium RIFCSPLOWO2_02_FULL_40_13b]
MVAVVNFGGQYAHLIARRTRELGIKSELISPDTSVENLKKLSPDALIFSGSPFSCYQKDAPKVDPKIYDLNLPILGICYGQQLMAYQLGGKVRLHSDKQFGKETIKCAKSSLFSGLSSSQTVWFSHGDQVDSLPIGFKIIASTKNAKFAAIENTKNKLYGIQFHAEVSHTPGGMQILANFLFKISNVKKDWNLEVEKTKIIKRLKAQIATDKLLMAISGGVDSLVAATLLKKAIGSNLYLIFIDTGLLRKNESSEVRKIVSSVSLKNLKFVNKRKAFLNILKRVIDPEEKRKKIAKLYFEILEEEAKRIGNLKYLGQGTIYPDRIESASTSKHADKIKSHHNVTLPKGLKLKIIEPLCEFYKDEVRKLGRILKIDENFLSRHPFPGPGLAIRVLGEVTEERLKILREADYIFTSELKKYEQGLYHKEAGGLKVGQAFAALLPVKAVGVMGDARTYSYIISLRSVDTEDFMTADWSKIPHEVLEKISSRIVNEVRGVNRVVYDITQKPPATIEYE